MALAAVALQDHMARSLSLHDPLKKKKINHSLPVKNSRNLTSKEKCSRKDEDQKKEYVLDPKPAPLTLGKCNADVVVQFNPWFKCFRLPSGFLGMAPISWSPLEVTKFPNVSINV